MLLNLTEKEAGQTLTCEHFLLYLGNKDIFISPPEHQRIKSIQVTEDKTEVDNTEQEEIKEEKENQFDMSCIMDSIFEVSHFRFYVTNQGDR